MNPARWIGPAVVAAALAASPAQAAATGGVRDARASACKLLRQACAPPRPAFEASRCGRLPRGVRPGRDLRCGYVRVPLRHGRPDGPSIRLAVRVVEGGSGTPLMLLGGGPGESVVTAAGQLAAARAFTVTRDRDVILFDQRGAGESRPELRCDRELAGLTSADTAALAAAYGACATRLRTRTDLDAYKTLENAKDVDAVRRALGLRRVHVFGTSYGARLALMAAAGTPPWIASLVLSSPIPGDGNFVADAPRSFERALQALFATCAANAECNGRYPDLAAKLDAVMAQLEAAPVPLPSGSVLPALDANTAATLIFALFYSQSGVVAVPEVITRLAAGEYAFLVEDVLGDLSASPISDGMQRAFICSEEVPRTTPAAIEESLAGLSRAPVVLGRRNVTIGLPTIGICSAFGVTRAPDRTFERVRSRTPALVVTGTFDQITPPSYGVRTVRGLARGRLIELPTGHSPLLNSGRCGLALLRTFLQAPTARLRRPAACGTGGATAASAGREAAPWERIGRALPGGT